MDSNLEVEGERWYLVSKVVALSHRRSGYARTTARRARHHYRCGRGAGDQEGWSDPSLTRRPFGVHVEVEPFGPTTPRTGPGSPGAEVGAAGQGRYVEFDLPPNAIRTDVGPRNTAVIPTRTPLPIHDKNPTFR